LLSENFSGKYFRIRLYIGLGWRLPTLEESALDWGKTGQFEPMVLLVNVWPLFDSVRNDWSGFAFGSGLVKMALID
jgi:hypothetical protein